MLDSNTKLFHVRCDVHRAKSRKQINAISIESNSPRRKDSKIMSEDAQKQVKVKVKDVDDGEKIGDERRRVI